MSEPDLRRLSPSKGRGDGPSPGSGAVLGRYEAYFFDLDGTIYLGEQALPGAARTIQALQSAGAAVRYLSNNPTRTPGEYAAKLTRLGIPTSPSAVITTIQTTIWWLRTYHPQATVFPIAEAPLIEALTGAGFRISQDPSQIDIVIASYDRTFTYAKLQTAFDALWRGGESSAGASSAAPILIQTNCDPYCPFPGGRGEPDAAAITAAIEACAGVRCQASMGKPGPFLLQAALADLDIPLERCLMTGDRLATDIRMALDAGMDAAVVFTGQTQPGDLTAQYAGVWQLNGLADLTQADHYADGCAGLAGGSRNSHGALTEWSQR